MIICQRKNAGKNFTLAYSEDAIHPDCIIGLVKGFTYFLDLHYLADIILEESQSYIMAKTDTTKHKQIIDKLQAKKIKLEQELKIVTDKLRKEIYKYDKAITATFNAEEY